jgi:hypothetical protein
MLKIFAYGTDYFMETYSKDLMRDCSDFGYSLHLEKVPAGSFSHLNHYIHVKMLEVVKNAGPDDRILFLDPECRIHKPIPQEWIDDERPIVCYKISDGKHERESYQYGLTLPAPIQMQPIFLRAKDINWIQWWYDLSMAASDPVNNQYVPHELFLELAVKFNKVDAREELCIYNREYTKKKHLIVKGSWTTEDTIITHPAIHGVLDPNVKHANAERKASSILNRRELHNHFQDFELIKLIDQLMLQEKDVAWPPQCVKVDGWYEAHNWLFNPKEGLVKHKHFPLEKYHYHIRTKIARGIKTPVTRKFSHETSLV